MARRPIIARKPKIVRTTRSEQYLVNKKYMGDEPSFTKPLTLVDCSHAFNWYNYMATTEDAKEYLVEFLVERKRPAEARIVKGIPDSVMPTTLGWIARMYSKGYILPIDTDSYFHEKLPAVLTAFAKDEPLGDTEEAPKVSVQDRMKERFHDIMGEIEGLIDDNLETNDEFSLYFWLKENNIPAAYVSRIIQKLSPVLQELMEAYKTTDEQLKEGYSNLSKPELKKIIKFYDGLIRDADQYADTTKKTRAPRKPRAVSVEKKLKNLKFQKEETTFKIASILPEKIIGGQELWTFNTKYKTLTVLRAQDRGGLQVKGTSITNYDPQNSFTKGTGRKTEEIIRRVSDGGKLVLRKVMGELKTDKALAYRINENTILLKVVT